MKSENELESKLMYKKNLRDVLVSGFIDSEDYCMFHPLYERIYFIISDGIIEMSVGKDAKIILNFVKKIDVWFDIEKDDKFALMSIYSLLFKTEQEIKIASVYYKDSILSEIRMEYSDGGIIKSIIFEPRNFFGFSFLTPD